MFISRFKNYLQFEKRFSEHTLLAYIKDINQFESFIASSDLDFALVTHQHVRSWMVSLLELKCSARTINRKLSVLRSFYKFLQREKLLEKNPTLQVKAPKVAKRLPVIINEDKLNTLLDSDVPFSADFEGLRDRLVLEFLFGTGIRLAELIAIQPGDIDGYGQSVRIYGKRRKERIVPLYPSLVKLIDKYICEKNNLSFENISHGLIVTSTGKAAYPKLIYRIVKRYLAYITTNQKSSPHILRHTFATSLLNDGADLNAIKELLGHASLAATQVYTHNSAEKLKSIYKQAHPRA